MGLKELIIWVKHLSRKDLFFYSTVAIVITYLFRILGLSRWIPVAWMISRFYNRFRWSNQEELKNAQKDEVAETRGSRLEKIEEDLDAERAENIKNSKENVYATGNGEGDAVVRPKVGQNLKKRKPNKILSR